MDNSLASTPTPRALGKIGGELAESFAWLNSPARIHNEITTHEAAIRQGDASAETAALLQDWCAIRRAQKQLLAEMEEE